MKKLAPVLFLGLAVLPLFAGLVYALLYSLGLVGALNSGFTLGHWQKILADAPFWASIGLSAGIAAVVALLSTTLALALLVWLRPALERPRVQVLLHFPLAIPPIVAAFVSFHWFGSSGMLARLACKLGWIDHPDAFPPLINDPFYLGTGLTLTLLTFPFLLLLLLEQYRAANLAPLSQLAAALGAPPAYINIRVAAPVLLRRAAPTLLLYGLFLFGAYEVPLLLGRQNPAMVSVFISQKFRKFNLADLPVAYAATLVYAVLVAMVVALLLRKKALDK